MLSRYQALQDERAQRETEASAILEAVRAGNRTEMTAEEATRFDAATARIDVIKTELAREEKAREFERNKPAASVAEAAPKITGGHDRAMDKPWGADTGAPWGEFLQAVHRAHTGRQIDPRLMAPYTGAAGQDGYRAALGATEGVGADGGFLVNRDMQVDLSTFLQTGEVYSRVTRIPISAGANSLSIAALDETNLGDGYQMGGVTAYWVGEGATITGSRPQFRTIDLKLNKVASLYYASDELLEDATALNTIAFDFMRQALLWKVENAIIRGVGGATPVGILNANALIANAAEAGQAAATILYENILGMWKRLHGSLRPNAVWFINQDIESELYRISLPVGTSGVPVFMPPTGAAGAPYSTLFGRPVIPIPYASTLGTAGDIILADLSKYIVIEKGGPMAASSVHFAFSTAEQAFRMTMRVDGQPWLRSALTPAQGTSTTSAFVVTATR